MEYLDKYDALVKLLTEDLLAHQSAQPITRTLESWTEATVRPTS